MTTFSPFCAITSGHFPLPILQRSRLLFSICLVVVMRYSSSVVTTISGLQKLVECGANAIELPIFYERLDNISSRLLSVSVVLRFDEQDGESERSPGKYLYPKLSLNRYSLPLC